MIWLSELLVPFEMILYCFFPTHRISNSDCLYVFVFVFCVSVFLFGSLVVYLKKHFFSLSFLLLLGWYSDFIPVWSRFSFLLYCSNKEIYNFSWTIQTYTVYMHVYFAFIKDDRFRWLFGSCLLFCWALNIFVVVPLLFSFLSFRLVHITIYLSISLIFLSFSLALASERSIWIVKNNNNLKKLLPHKSAPFS